MSGSANDEEIFEETHHWGEIQDCDPDLIRMPPDVSEDIKRSMQKDCLDQYSCDGIVLRITDLNIPPMDPLIMYAIQLHKWMNNMIEMIRLAEVAAESNLIPAEDAKVPIPEIPDVPWLYSPKKFDFLPTKTDKELKEDDVEIPELSREIVKKILTKSVAVMTAQIGYEESLQSVMDVFVDVVEQFLVKVCNRFASAINEEESLHTGGFPNVLERVLVELGLGGSKGLHDYYQSRVVKYITVLHKRCEELEQYYLSLIVPKSESPTGIFGGVFKVRVKKEEDNADSDSEMGYSQSELITSNSQLISNLEPAPDEMMQDNDQMMFTNFPS